MKKLTRDYSFKYHLVGRIWTALAVLLFLSIPLAIGLYYGETPDWKVFGSAAVIIPLLINFISGIVEPIIYAPMLGTNGEYLAFITGNLSNLKIPCVVKAQEICGTKMGTEEHEVVSTLAVATSTLVTVLVIGILVLCLAFTNLQSAVMKNRWILPAFSCVVYALFGSLGGRYIAKNPKLALIPAAIIVVLSVILGVTGVGGGIGSAYLFIGIGVCALFAVAQFSLQKKKLRAKQEEERLAAISDSHDVQADEAQNTGESSVEGAADDSENSVDARKTASSEKYENFGSETSENESDPCADKQEAQIEHTQNAENISTAQNDGPNEDK